MWLIIGMIVMVLVIFLVVPSLVHRFIGPALQRRVSNVYAPEQVVLQDLKARGYGLQSKGAFQARGNGALVLTAGELHYFQFTPESNLRIPLDAITEVKTVRSHLGKATGRDLLHVAFSIDGKSDAMAWDAPDVGAWITRLGPGTREPGA